VEIGEITLAAEKVTFRRLLKNAQRQGARGFSLPVSQAILRSEAYLDVRRNGEG
jgi:hypothetical protein